MTPYRERREQGHYDSPTNTPASVHSTHLPGLLTGTKPPEEELPTEDEQEVEESETDDAGDLDDMTKAELLDLAKTRGISPANAAMSKDELREALTGT